MGSPYNEGRVNSVESVSRRALLRTIGLGGVAAGTLVFGGGILTACSSSDGSSSNGSSSNGSSAKASSSAKLESYDIVISAYPTTLRNLPWMVAEQQGLWAKHGLKVAINASEGGGTTLNAMNSGNVPYADGALSAAIQARAANIPVVSIGVMSQAGFGYFQSAKNSIKTPSDLAGKTIGYSTAGSSSEFLAYSVAAK